MTTDEIRKKVEEAQSAVHGLQEPFLSEAFRVILGHLLRTGSGYPVNPITVPESGETQEDNFAGLSGGLRHLVSTGFFVEPKTATEIFDELKRNAYHYPRTSLPRALIDMVKTRKLSRKKGSNGTWQYVVSR